jgi:peptidoglycan hydrolase CwlO-like protein
MEKWFLLDNSKIIGPFDVTEAQKLIVTNPNLYAWQPSYSHWTPVNQISQFTVAAKVPLPPIDVPEELMDAFVEEERELIAKLDNLDEQLSPLTSDIAKVSAELNRYQQLTHSLNNEIKTVIANIEQQYAALQQNLVSATKTKLT